MHVGGPSPPLPSSDDSRNIFGFRAEAQARNPKFAAQLEMGTREGPHRALRHDRRGRTVLRPRRNVLEGLGLKECLWGVAAFWA